MLCYAVSFRTLQLLIILVVILINDRGASVPDHSNVPIDSFDHFLVFGVALYRYCMFQLSVRTSTENLRLCLQGTTLSQRTKHTRPRFHFHHVERSSQTFSYC